MNRLKRIMLALALVLSMVGMSAFYVSASSTATEEIRENASRTGLDSTEKSTTQTATQATTQAVPNVVSTKNETATTEEVDTTKGKLKITIEPEKKGFYNESAKMIVKVEKVSTKAPRTNVEKVEYKIGASGSWQDITDDMYFDVTENCTVYVKVTDQYGNEYEKSRLIKIFDTVAPTLNAAVNEGLLTVMTYDTESGVDCIYINGYKYVPDKNGIVSIRLQKFDATYQKFYIYAIDNAGNTSQVNTVQNPYWTDPNAETDDNEDTKNPAEDLPDNAQASTTGTSSAEVTSVTDENGEDITDQISGKQFYSIITSDGQQYYLVIDMTYAQKKDREENAAYTGTGVSATSSPNNGTVYFLTSVSSQNLLNFVNDGEQTLPHNSVAANNSIDPDEVTPVSDESVTEEKKEEEDKEVKPEKKKSSFQWWYIPAVIAGILIFAIIIVAGKNAKSKKGKPEQNDDAMYDDERNEQEEAVPLEELDEKPEE